MTSLNKLNVIKESHTIYTKAKDLMVLVGIPPNDTKMSENLSPIIKR